jgi:hypothetical protein
MTLVFSNEKVLIDSYTKIGERDAILRNSTGTMNRLETPLKNFGKLVNKYTVPTGKQFEIINIAVNAQNGQQVWIESSNGISQVGADVGTFSLRIAGTTALEFKCNPTDMLFLDPQGSYNAGGNRNRGQDPSKSVIQLQGVAIAEGETCQLLWSPVAAANNPTGVEIRGQRISGSIQHSGGIAQGAIVPFNSNESNSVVCSVTAPAGGLTLHSIAFWSEHYGGPSWICVTVDGRLLFDRPFAACGKNFRSKELRCGCTGLKLYPGQTIECWVNAVIPTNQLVGCQIVGDETDFGSDRFTDPGIANVKTGTNYKFNSETENRTGTLSASGGGGSVIGSSIIRRG